MFEKGAMQYLTRKEQSHQSWGVAANSTPGSAPVSRWITLPDGIVLHAQEWAGAGPTCVLIHGSGEGAYVWSDLARALHPDYRVLACDLRGHGDSHWDPRGRYSTDTYADDMRFLLRSLNVERCMLVGHSLGGQVAIRVAAKLDAALRALILVDFAPTAMNEEARAFAHGAFMEQFRSYRSVEAFARFIERKRPALAASALLELARCSLRLHDDGTYRLKCDPAIAGERTSPADDQQLKAELAAIDCPVLLVRGLASAILPAQRARQVLECARDGQMRTIEKAGHAVMIDNPAAFTEAVSAFLRALPRT